MPEQVDMIASGYEWTCPDCGRLNPEIEALTQVICGKSNEGGDLQGAQGCGHTFSAAPPAHAYA